MCDLTFHYSDANNDHMKRLQSRRLCQQLRILDCEIAAMGFNGCNGKDELFNPFNVFMFKIISVKIDVVTDQDHDIDDILGTACP